MDKHRELLLEYARISQQAKEFEVMLGLMKPDVVAALAALNPKDRSVAVAGVGRFDVASRRKYSYSTEIVEMEEDLKDARKEAERTGAATYKETEYVVFRAEKDNA